MNLVHAEHEKNYLDFIAPDFAKAFEGSVIHAYEDYSSRNKFFAIPEYMYQDEDFTETFEEPEYFLMETNFLEMHGKYAGEVDEDVAQDFMNEYDYNCPFASKELIADIENVLNHHQFFYVTLDSTLTENLDRYYFFRYENSPLQEVW